MVGWRDGWGSVHQACRGRQSRKAVTRSSRPPPPTALLLGRRRHGEVEGRMPCCSQPPSPAASPVPAEGDAPPARASGSEFPPSEPPPWLHLLPPAPSPAPAGVLTLPSPPSETDAGPPGPRKRDGQRRRQVRTREPAGACGPGWGTVQGAPGQDVHRGPPSPAGFTTSCRTQ